MSRKRGKLSTEEEDFIRKHADSMSSSNIAIHLNRTEETVLEFLKKNKLTYAGMSEASYDDAVLGRKLIDRPYWGEVKKQFTEDELLYFTVTWMRIIKQFREDILYTEELQVKQWITLEILSNRVMVERKRAVEQVDRLQVLITEEYNVLEMARNVERIAALETELSMIRNSLGSYTTEHSKILDRVKDIQKDLKAARADRVKKVEDSKGSWSGFMKSLEDEELRAKVGEDLAIMALAQQQARADFSKLHTYEDGQVDQPILTVDNAIHT